MRAPAGMMRTLSRLAGRAAAAAAAVIAVAAAWWAYRAPTLVLSYALDAPLCGVGRPADRRTEAAIATAPAPAASAVVR